MSESIFNMALYPMLFLDYAWVITLYGTMAFWVAVFMDGYVLPKFDEKDQQTKSNMRLYLEVIFQIAVQGFIAIAIIALVQKIPSPLEGVLGYTINSSYGILMRNPAIITAILMALSETLRKKLMILFDRFSKF